MKQDINQKHEMNIYHVFKGIDVIYMSIHGKYFDMTHNKNSSNYLKIHYCLEGRMENHIDDQYFYLTNNDVALVLKKDVSKDYRFPTSHYHGMMIIIDLDVISSTDSIIMNEFKINIQKLVNQMNYCLKMIRINSELASILRQTYQYEQKEQYLKIKVLELLYTLSHMELKAEKEIIVSKNQLELAHAIIAYVEAHLDQKFTIHELASQFHISPTYLKNVIKKVYGMSVSMYIRGLKMKKASRLLIQRDKTIQEIALEFGYQSESKFSNAFKSIMNETPSQYRNHIKANETL